VIAGRYSLDLEIGRGGMGAVWRGHDQVLGRTVAIKRIGVAPGGSMPDVFRAEREARLAAQLNHPHVVAIFDLVEEGDEHWLVMEYVEGTNLSELVASNGALTPDELAPLIAQAADALAAAHTAGIVHRDVKPSNMLVTPDGTVKLTDFGIARTQADAALTQTGLVTGSPAYLAPEVASGQLATAASDVWSIGATVYHALVGQPPYEIGDNVLGALYRIVHEEPPRPPRPGWLAPLLEGTMTRQPQDRWSAATVRDFLQAGPVDRDLATVPMARPPAVARAEEQSTQVLAPAPAPAPAPVPPPAVTSTPHRERRTPWGLIALAVLAIALASFIAFAVASQLGEGDGGRDPAAGQSSSGPADPSSPTAAEPTVEDMESFVATYLDTVVSDPESAFGMLTPGFQDASGGLKEYLAFWGDVTSTELDSVDADPGALTVSYHYRYVTKGKGSTEDDVRLQLEFDDGTYLIAGEA
jgi:serine/threonine protein kinase